MSIDSLVIFDNNGQLCMIVHDAQNYADIAWTRPGGVAVKIPRATYDAILPAKNIDGIAVYYDLYKVVATDVAKASPIIGSKLQAKIAVTDAKIADIATAEAAQTTAMRAFFTVLDNSQKDTIGTSAFLRSLTPEQLAVAPLSIKQAVAALPPQVEGGGVLVDTP